MSQTFVDVPIRENGQDFYASWVNLLRLAGIDLATAVSTIQGIASTDALKLPTKTTTERDALTPSAGWIIYNSTTTQYEKYNGSAWEKLSPTDILTTNGDILYYNSGYNRLAKGSDGQVLKLSSGLPSWGNETYTAPRIIGSLIDYCGVGAASHTLVCNGESIGGVGSGADNESADYETLFDILKSSWGNAGTEVFGDGDTVLLPDLRGMFTRGTGTHGSLTKADTDSFEGPSVGESENDMMQGHYHNYSVISGAIVLRTTPETQDWVSTGGNDSSYTTWNTTNFNVTSPKTDGTNGTPRTGGETRPVSYGVSKCIIFE